MYKLNSHSLSQILNQNDKIEIKYLICHKEWTKITHVYIYFIISVKNNFNTQLFKY